MVYAKYKKKRQYRRINTFPVKALATSAKSRKYARTVAIRTDAKDPSTTLYKRHSAFGAPSFSIQTGRLPLSRGGFYRLPFSESFALSADGSIGTADTNYTYNLVSPYDPRFQIGGAQPIQWDTITPAYERYQVWGAKFTITFSNPLNDGAFIGFRVRSTLNPVATEGLTIAELKETDLTRSRFINNSGRQVESFTGYIKPWHIYGISKTQYVNLEYTAQDTTTPIVGCLLEPFLLHTVFGEINTIRCTVRIVYFVQMMQGQTILDV